MSQQNYNMPSQEQNITTVNLSQNDMPPCQNQEASLELRATNAIDLEIFSQIEENSVENNENINSFRAINQVLTFESSGNSSESDQQIGNIPNLDQIFINLGRSMEQFYQQNSRSLSLLEIYINNFDQLAKIVQRPKKPILKTIKVHSKKAECSICFNKIQKNIRIPKLKCKHKFHKKCLEHWIQHKTNCPLCRRDIE